VQKVETPVLKVEILFYDWSKEQKKSWIANQSKAVQKEICGKFKLKTPDENYKQGKNMK
jgi:hypothetical protein